MPKSLEKPHIALIVFCLVMCLGALITEGFTVQLFLHAVQIKSWPTVPGVITRSDLETKFVGATQHTAHIEYNYAVGGTSYTSSRVRTRGTTNKHHSDIAAVVAKFPVGSQVPVYYNIADPSEAYLEAGVDVVNYIIIVSPIVFAFLFGAGFYDLCTKRWGRSTMS